MPGAVNISYLAQACMEDNLGTIHCCTCQRLNLLWDKVLSSILLRETGTLPSFKVAVFKYLLNLDITSYRCTVV